MERIVSTPDPDTLGRVPQSTPDDVRIVDLRERERPLQLSPEFNAEQTRILDDELRDLLSTAASPADTTPPADTVLPADTPPANGSDSSVGSSVIPGFEALTWDDLAEARRIGDLLDGELDRHLPGTLRADESTEPRACPRWCRYADTKTTTDIATDATTDTATGIHGPDLGEHVGVGHTIQVARGGSTFGHDGVPATVAVHLEQDRNQHTPTIVLGITVNSTEHEAHVTPTEARTLHSTLAALLRDADDGDRPG